MLSKFLYWIAEQRYYWAMFWFHLNDHIPYGDPILGATREERNRNIRLMHERARAREPKPQQFGLPVDYQWRWGKK